MASSGYNPEIMRIQEQFGNYLSDTRSFKTEEALEEYTKPIRPSDNALMENGVSHYELDAKIEALEARADARFSNLEMSIKQALDEIRRDRTELKNELASEQVERRADAKSLKNTMIVTGVGTAITIVLGVAAFNATVLSNMVASFESGKNTATTITQAAEQFKATQEQLKAVQEQLQSVKPKK